MMTPELKAEWVAALRSGSYNQGQNTLRDCNDNYCCLGVLCDIIPGNTWKAIEGDVVYQARLEGLHTSTAVFPYGLRVSYGLDKQVDPSNHDLEYTETIHDHLIDMNDNGESFNTIADYIEANL